MSEFDPASGGELPQLFQRGGAVLHEQVALIEISFEIEMLVARDANGGACPAKTRRKTKARMNGGEFYRHHAGSLSSCSASAVSGISPGNCMGMTQSP